MNNSKLFSSGIYSLLQNLLALFFGFGSFYLLARLQSKSAFGLWATFMTISSLLEVARNGLVQNSKIKFLHANPDQEAEITTASLFINFIACTTIGLLVLVCSPLLETTLKAKGLSDLLLINVVTSIVLIPFSQANILQQSRFNFGPVIMAVGLRTGLLFLFITYKYVVGLEVPVYQLVLVQLLSALAGSLVAIVGLKGQFSIAKTIDWSWVKKLLGFGKYVFGTNLCAIFYSSVDQLMLGKLTNMATVATYNNAVRINTLAEVPVAAAAGILYPYKVQLHHSEDKAKAHEVFYKGVGAVAGLLLPVVLLAVLFPTLIITVISSNKYQDAAPLLQMLALSALLQPFLRQFGTQMDSAGRPDINFRTSLAMAFLNTVLNYLFIKWWGITGAAIATLTTQFSFLLISGVLLYKYFQIKLHYALLYLPTAYSIAWKRFRSLT